MSLHSLPIFIRLAGRAVILVGEGEAAAAKRRLLDRAGAVVVDEAAEAALAIVATDDPDPVVARLRGRGVLVNAVDRPDLCDFTLPAIVDRDPVLIAVGTGGVSAGLAAALRQRLEAVLPADLGRTAETLRSMRDALRRRYPDGGERRRAIAAMLAEGGAMDVLGGAAHSDPPAQPARPASPPEVATITLRSPDPDDLTLREARWLANADLVVHEPGVPTAILDRARADAERRPAPAASGPGPTVVVRMA